MGALRSSSATVSGWPPGLALWRGVSHSSQARSAVGNDNRSSASTVWPPSLAALA
ncbi:hypothetical protein AACK17_18785 [Pectobacterium punjabense]|uniref:hypothetical protein n=1 Tax=Pectobacterium punjabense TaxID=2108399 RepID=UPI001BFF22BB|nr:hypothetical protein [Pectobacterium punjabense]MBT9186604.1 hypothetical protein [Pectobacterium punjabense]